MRATAGRTAIAITLAAVSGCASVPNRKSVDPVARAADPLLAGFQSPPHAARPQVWWHWMNGNVDAKEAVADLEWAAAQGIGGVHIFQGGLGSPQVVAHRLEYMSPAWKDALRSSVVAAHRLGLDVSIPTSPGWSATGGPWVTPEAAMKKLVWSETRIVGGTSRPKLALPPVVAGPYQDVAADDPAPAFYRDVAVVAFPAQRRPLHLTLTDPSLNEAMLTDGRFGPIVRLPSGSDGVATITYRSDRSTRVGAVHVGLPAPHGFGAPPPPTATLEASNDGQTWREVADLAVSTAPARSAAFRPVTARWFRLRLAPSKVPDLLATAPHEPGATQLLPPPPKSGFAVSEFALYDGGRIGAAEAKAGFAAVLDYDAVRDGSMEHGINPATILDLTERLRADGTLDWTPPSGSWTVLRFGMSPTGHRNGPAPAEATGLEVDKLSARHVEAYLERYLGDFDAALSGITGLNGLLSDSIEAGAQNWTDDMSAAFRQRRGYALTRFLPALAGYRVGTAGESDAFLYDFRRTIADLLAEAHYGTIARIAKKRGLTYYAEALEDHRPQLGDDLAMRAAADVPAGAMWFFEPGTSPKPTYLADLKGAASVAHVMGRPVVAVEALTSFGYPWTLTPVRMRAAADAAFLAGGNRLMLHSMVHQAVGERVFPGLALLPQLGHNFNRNEVWAPFARGWIDYLARSQFLLQQGTPQADVAYFVGEEAPVTGLFGEGPPAGVPEGLSYDYVNATLLGRLTLVDGKLHGGAGNAYAFLFLGGASRLMTSVTLSRLEELAAAGVTIAGRQPMASPSLADRNDRLALRVAALWRHPNVLDVGSVAEAAERLGVRPGWRYRGTGAIQALHRVVPDGDLFYLVNQGDSPAVGRISVSSSRAHAQWWDAVTGNIERADRDPNDGIAVALPPHQSQFLLLRDGGVEAPTWLPDRTIATASGPWTVDLMTRDRPFRRLSMVRPTPLDRHPDASVRTFSGTARYRGRIVLPRHGMCRGEQRLIALADPGGVARVTINGVTVGDVWSPPFRVDATSAIRAGVNDLDITVAVSWKNRLVEEANAGNEAAKRLYQPGTPLIAAGLQGEVRLISRCPLRETTLRPVGLSSG